MINYLDTRYQILNLIDRYTPNYFLNQYNWKKKKHEFINKEYIDNVVEKRWISNFLDSFDNPHMVFFEPHKKQYLLPIILKEDRGKLIIIDTLLPLKHLPTDVEVLSINDQSIAELRNEVNSKFSNYSRAYRIKKIIEKLIYLGDDSEVAIKYQEGNQIKNAIIKPVTPDIAMKYMKINLEDIEKPYIALKENNILYFRPSNFQNKNIASIYLNAISQFENIENLVLDLRGNSGGLVDETLIFASSFVNHITKIGHKIVKNEGQDIIVPIIVTPSKEKVFRFRKIIIVHDGLTMSAAEFILIKLFNTLDNAISIGEETAGLQSEANMYQCTDNSVIQIISSIILDKNNSIAGKNSTRSLYWRETTIFRCETNHRII